MNGRHLRLVHTDAAATEFDPGWTDAEVARWEETQRISRELPGNAPGGWTVYRVPGFLGPVVAIVVLGLVGIVALVAEHVLADAGATGSAALAFFGLLAAGLVAALAIEHRLRDKRLPQTWPPSRRRPAVQPCRRPRVEPRGCQEPLDGGGFLAAGDEDRMLSFSSRPWWDTDSLPELDDLPQLDDEPEQDDEAAALAGVVLDRGSRAGYGAAPPPSRGHGSLRDGPAGRPGLRRPLRPLGKPTPGAGPSGLPSPAPRDPYRVTDLEGELT
jgi:hypothetical protein